MDASDAHSVVQQGNRLAKEQSPYLLQHAHNPVDWYPWGEEALGAALRLDKPILLSVGYSACHWCHVMERESFEDPGISSIMNRHYISIKVDREERPDIDALYQPVAQALTGGGGWPLTVFLTPDLRPLFCGTYYPPRAKYGRPGFADVLEKVAAIYRDDPSRVAELTESLSRAMVAPRSPARCADCAPSSELVEAGAKVLLGFVDKEWGGLGKAPKFPNTTALSLLLRAGRNGLEGCLEAVISTLTHMARGGIYDQLGGGFHRYSTDRQWLTPHFEKMLYDNALIPLTLLDAFQVTGYHWLADTTRETLAYLLRDMRHPQGGLYSSEDADSEGEEGRFYVWTPAQVRSALSPLDAELAMAQFGVSSEGNFGNGASILTAAAERAPLEALSAVKAALLKERATRVRPSRDEKTLAGWNGLALSAFARAGRILGSAEFTEAARRIAGFIEASLSTQDSRLMRSFRERASGVAGFLDDYAFVARGLVDLYEASLEPAYLVRAREIARLAVSGFWDESTQTLYDVAADAASTLPARPWGYADESVPSGAAVLMETILRLGRLLGDECDAEIAALPARVLSQAAHDMETNPWAYASMLGVLDMHSEGVTQVTLIPGDKSGGVRELLLAASSVYSPNLVLYGPLAEAGLGEGGSDGDGPIGGLAAAHVCRGFACQPPVTDAQGLRQLLSGEVR